MGGLLFLLFVRPFFCLLTFHTDFPGITIYFFLLISHKIQRLPSLNIKRQPCFAITYIKNKSTGFKEAFADAISAW